MQICGISVDHPTIRKIYHPLRIHVTWTILLKPKKNRSRDIVYICFLLNQNHAYMRALGCSQPLVYYNPQNFTSSLKILTT